MVKYISRRMVGMVPTMLILLFLVVVMVELIPGDIIDIVLQERLSPDAESRQRLEEQLGLDRPLPVRYVQYIGGVVTGDLGKSLWTGEPVMKMIATRAIVTIEVGTLATIFGALIGVTVGMISALRQDTWLDYSLRSVAILFISVPNFAIATFVVVMPAIWWGVSPNLRYVSFFEAPWPHLKIIIIPALVLAIGLAASLMRLTRTTMLDVLRQDYIRTASAKGLRESGVVLKHALKNAFIPVITLLGLQVAALIGGTVITESVFVIPGVGRLMLTAIAQRDYPIVQGVVVLVGLYVMTVNLGIDLVYAFLDPRIRYA